MSSKQNSTISSEQRLVLGVLSFIIILKVLILLMLNIGHLYKVLVFPGAVVWDLLIFGGIYQLSSSIPLIAILLVCAIGMLIGCLFFIYFLQTRNFIDWFLLDDMLTDLNVLKTNIIAFQSYLIQVFVLFVTGLVIVAAVSIVLSRVKIMSPKRSIWGYRWLVIVLILSFLPMSMLPFAIKRTANKLIPPFVLAPCVAYAARAWRVMARRQTVLTKFNIHSTRSRNQTYLGPPQAVFKGDRPNVVVIFIESMIDDLLNYNQTSYLAAQLQPKFRQKSAFESNIAPFLNRLKNQSWFFPSIFTHSSYTIKSTLSSLCSVHVLERSTSEHLAESYAPCLTKLLKNHDNANYSNAFFQPQIITFDNQQAVFRDFIGFERVISEETLQLGPKNWVNYFGVADEALREPVMKFVDKQLNASRPFFLSYLTGVSHHPFSTPANFIKKHFSDNRILNDYLNAQNYVDSFIRHLFTEFRSRNLTENSLFILVGDHGLQLGEHGAIGTPEGALDSTLKVPMMLYSENSAFQRRFRGKYTGKSPAINLDILPTIAGLLGIDITGMGHEGVNLATESDQADRVIYQVTNPANHHSIILRQRDYKLVLEQRSEQSFMFNLRTDPDELNPMEEEWQMSSEERKWFRWAEQCLAEERALTAQKYNRYNQAVS